MKKQPESKSPLSQFPVSEILSMRTFIGVELEEIHKYLKRINRNPNAKMNDNQRKEYERRVRQGTYYSLCMDYLTDEINKRLVSQVFTEDQMNARMAEIKDLI